MGRQAEINIAIHLDDKKVPQKIEWTATDAPFEGLQECGAVSVSLWDPEDRNTLSFDLWTGELTVDEMNFFLLQRLLKMAETCRRATQDPDLVELLEGFSEKFGEQLEAATQRK